MDDLEPALWMHQLESQGLHHVMLGPSWSILGPLHAQSKAHCITLLEAFRRWGVFDRQLVDLLVERMSDEVDRFTTRDLVPCRV